MSMASSPKDLAIGIVKVALLSLLLNIASSLSQASISCLCIKGMIVLALEKKRQGREKKRSRGEDNKNTPLLLLNSSWVALLDFRLVLNRLVALFGLHFVQEKFLIPRMEDPIPKPFKTSIFSFPGEQLLLL